MSSLHTADDPEKAECDKSDSASRRSGLAELNRPCGDRDAWLGASRYAMIVAMCGQSFGMQCAIS